MSSPFFPMIIPGLEVWMVTFPLCEGRSISILLTKELSSSFFRNSLTAKSLSKSS